MSTLTCPGPNCESLDCETVTLEIIDMIARQRAIPEILSTLCGRAWGSQTAFFLTEGEDWVLTAKGDLLPEGEEDLAAIHPGSLSEALFRTITPSGGQPECEFEKGWARHLYSETGELLGMLVGLAGRPVLPD